MRRPIRFIERNWTQLALVAVAASWVFRRLRTKRHRVELPAPTGPFQVGRLAFDWLDPARKEPYAPGKRRRRELSVWIWYPAEVNPGAQAGEYLPGRWRLTSLLWGFQASRVRAHAVSRAPVARGQERFPVLVFSPAAFAPHYYTALFEELASHGYVVVALSHTYEMLPVSVFADGRVRLFRPASVGNALQVSRIPHEEDVRKRARVVGVKAEDLSFVVDQLERLNAGTGLLAGRLDLDRLGALGHSLGGNAAAEFCRRDRRCRAVVDLDGGLWSEVSQEGIPRPFLMLFAEHPEYLRPCADSVRQKAFSSEEYCQEHRAFAVTGWQRLYASAQPGYSIQVRGAGHASFTDCGLLPLRSGSFARQSLGSIEGHRMWRVLSDYLLAFFDRHLRDRPAPLLDGPDPSHPEALFEPPEVLFQVPKA
ncbi:alpha/beta hydrolase family protein [Hyalangium rubrum]|uniref:Lipase n=1 Tax=Hyalangium rubrum TaxID=3103134 RepID=A0ABU5H8Y1_9BACT|nr:hypothetical protein [Hyalangium sp. s54d21]MDY7229696.1 hypothetical protein [Hyalangium sp. s54d21]